MSCHPRIERVVGSSGDRTLTQKSSLDGVPPQSQTYKYRPERLAHQARR
jgi:hypothetical protein